MQPLRIGIMSFAHLHAEGYIGNLRNMEGVEYIGFADDNPDRAAHFAAQFDSHLFKDYDEMLATKPDGVVICCENNRHRELVKMAASAGVHVLCEKPIATRGEDGEAIIKACDDAGVNLMIAFPMRFSAAAKQVKAALERGDMGAVRCANTTNQGENPDYHRGWFSDKELAGGGAVMDHTVHVVDMMRWYLNAEVTEVYAEVDNLFFPGKVNVDTAGLLMLQFDNGVFATLDTSWSRPGFYPTWGNVKIDLICERGVLHTDYFIQRLTVYEGAAKRPLWHYWGTDPNQLMLNEFVASVREKRTPFITGADGLAALRVVEAAYESGRTNQPVAVKQG